MHIRVIPQPDSRQPDAMRFQVNASPDGRSWKLKRRAVMGINQYFDYLEALARKYGNNATLKDRQGRILSLAKLFT